MGPHFFTLCCRSKTLHTHLLSFITVRFQIERFPANLLPGYQTWPFWLCSRSSWAETPDSCSSQLQGRQKEDNKSGISHPGKHQNVITLTHGIFPFSQTDALPPLLPWQSSFNTIPPPHLFLSSVVAPDAARKRTRGTIELTHASFPLPELCFPYGNPPGVCACSCNEGHRQSGTTTPKHKTAPQTEIEDSEPTRSTSQETVWV